MRILNDVVLNQVLVRFAPDDDDDAFTRAVIAGVQRDGTCWLGGTRWQGQRRCGCRCRTGPRPRSDIDRSAAAILQPPG